MMGSPPQPGPDEPRWVADEQAVLRRVATLVARGVPPAALFATVAEEVGRLFTAASSAVVRYEADGPVMVGYWTRTGDNLSRAVGGRAAVGGQNVTTLVFETGRPARIDSYPADDSSAVTAAVRGLSGRSAVGAPISVEGRLWGMLAVGSSREAGLPAGTEERLTDFAELVATAIANAEAREELRRIADEQAALRRVATLVAHGVRPGLVFAAVAEEVGALFGADVTGIGRFESEGEVTFLAGYGVAGIEPAAHDKLSAHPALASVRQTGRAVRFDADDPASTSMPEIVSTIGIRSVVDAAIVVEGRVWGFIGVASQRGRLPADTAQRLADFTELVATAIASAEAHTMLTASRARIVATADQTRRRIERDLHDGAQQRLVSLALQLRAAQAAVPAEFGALGAELERVAAGLTGALEELREIARGIHPAILSEGGLRQALRTLARRSPIHVDVQACPEGRFSEQVEVSAYYSVSEALTNAVKHAHASVVTVTVAVEAADDVLRISIHDDGIGGADFTRGTGLVGLRDRVEALGGQIAIDSPLGAGTAVRVEIPLTDVTAS
jgi:signal transduction histidine kinase